MSRSLHSVAFVMATLAFFAGVNEAYAKGDKQPKPTGESEVRFAFCGSATTLVTEKGVCYVYDLQEKKSFIEVRVAAGLILSGGNPVASAEGSAVIEVTVKFPLGTDEKAAVEVAKDELNKKLEGKEVAAFVKKQKEDPKKLVPFYEVEEVEPKDPLDKILHGLFED